MSFPILSLLILTPLIGALTLSLSNSTQLKNKTIFELSKELMDISSRAKEKRLKPDELAGSTFTVSSLGGIGGTSFSPIVNPPEVAILGVSKSKWSPVFKKETNDMYEFNKLKIFKKK